MLSAAAFVYVTAEIVPVGALPPSPAICGSVRRWWNLLASYALAAAVATVPLVRWTASWPRRAHLDLHADVSDGLAAHLRDGADVRGAGTRRVLCALTHGLMWSVIAPIGTRLVPASHAARATMAVYVGTALALVVGSPLTAALSQLWGGGWPSSRSPSRRPPSPSPRDWHYPRCR